MSQRIRRLVASEPPTPTSQLESFGDFYRVVYPIVVAAVAGLVGPVVATISGHGPRQRLATIPLNTIGKVIARGAVAFAVGKKTRNDKFTKVVKTIGAKAD